MKEKPLLTVPSSIRVTLPAPPALRFSSPFARAFLSAGKGTRWEKKLIRSLYSLFHRRLGLPAPGRMILASGRSFPIDGRETAFLEFAARSMSEGGFEPEVSALLTHLAARLSVVYDAGANWGYYPLLLGTDPRFKGRVHAFEIRPQTAALLSGVVRSAGLEERVSVHAFGLSSKDGEVRLTREKHSYLCRIVGEDYRGPTDLVAVRRLDRTDLPPPDFIKIDVEGHEAAVLAGAERLLARRRPMIVFESWYEKDAPERMLAPLHLLARQGYALFRLLWRPERAEREGTLAFQPLEPQDRPAVGEAQNLFALHPERAGAFFSAESRARGAKLRR